MHGKRLDIRGGDRFGRLTIIREDGTRNPRYFVCICDCGIEKTVRLDNLTRGLTVSCGCYSREVSKAVNWSHGLYQTRVYQTWKGMKGRCLNPNNDFYRHYGGRGITVCNEWLRFEPFYQWAMSHGYQDDLTIERVNNNGNYEPANCTWITVAEQRRNTTRAHKIAFNDQRKTLRQWASQMGINVSTLCFRLKSGWSLEETLSTPAYGRSRKNSNGN